MGLGGITDVLPNVQTFSFFKRVKPVLARGAGGACARVGCGGMLCVPTTPYHVYSLLVDARSTQIQNVVMQGCF